MQPSSTVTAHWQHLFCRSYSIRENKQTEHELIQVVRDFQSQVSLMDIPKYIFDKRKYMFMYILGCSLCVHYVSHTWMLAKSVVDSLSLPVTDVPRQLQQSDQVLGHIHSQSDRTEREKTSPIFIPLYLEKST